MRRLMLNDFCRRMVTCVCVVPAHTGILVSGSADGTVRSWRYMDGQLVSTHNLPSIGIARGRV